MIAAMLAAVGAAAVFYLLLILFLALFQREMIYHPDPRLVSPADVGLADMAPVPVRGEDRRLITSWYAPPARAGAPTVLMFHGNAGTNADRAHKARRLIDQGFGVFMAEYRGFAGNPGQPGERALCGDARAALHWLISQGIAPGRIVLYGESLGSGVATAIAAETPAALALILECPFTALPDLAPAYIPSGLARLLMTDHFDNLARIAPLAMPLLIIHGSQDTLTPPWMAEALARAATSPDKALAMLPHGHHNDLWDHGAGERVIAAVHRLSGRPPAA